jgi:tetratricopeptide (TPR) repeat protein
MNNRLKKLSLVFGLVFAFNFSNNAFAANDKEGVVRGSYINLRAEPKFDAQIVGKKMRGDVYTIEFEQSNWLKVRFKDNTEGWIYKSLIETIYENDNSKTSSEKATESNTEKKADQTKKDNKVNKESKEKTSNKDVKQTEKKEVKTEKPLIKPVNQNKLPEVVEVSGTAEELYNEAIRLYEKRKYSEALEMNVAASKKAPKNAEILNNLGNCQFKLGRIEDALDSWKKALRIAPRSGKICNNLGIAYYQLDNNKDAIEYYKKAIMFEPDFADPYYNIASVYGFTGNFEDALTNYKKFLEFNPDDTMKKLADERIAYCERQLNKASK